MLPPALKTFHQVRSILAVLIANYSCKNVPKYTVANRFALNRYFHKIVVFRKLSLTFSELFALLLDLLIQNHCLQKYQVELGSRREAHERS